MSKNVNQFALNPIVKAEVAQRLRGLRLAMAPELTIEDAAQVIGVTRKTYSSWEDETKTALPSDWGLTWALCELYDSTPMYLMTGLFREQGEVAKHSKEYLDIYDRYQNNPDFHFLLSVLMERSDVFIKGMAALMETISDEYEGVHPMLRS